MVWSPEFDKTSMADKVNPPTSGLSCESLAFSFRAAKPLNGGLDGGWVKDVARPQSCHGDYYCIPCLGISGTLAPEASQSIRNVCCLQKKQRGRRRRKASGGFSVSRECAERVSPQTFGGFQRSNEHRNAHLYKYVETAIVSSLMVRF